MGKFSNQTANTYFKLETAMNILNNSQYGKGIKKTVVQSLLWSSELQRNILLLWSQGTTEKKKIIKGLSPKTSDGSFWKAFIREVQGVLCI